MTIGEIINSINSLSDYIRMREQDIITDALLKMAISFEHKSEMLEDMEKQYQAIKNFKLD